MRDRRASCAPSGATLTGAVCVNVLRHPAWGRAQETYGEDPVPRRRARRRVHPRPATPRDGVREALRLQLDGERPLHRRHRGRRGRAPRGVPPALPADRRRGRRVGDVRRTTASTASGAGRAASCSPTSCAASGASRASSSATGSSGCATRPRSLTAGLDIEMPYRMVRAQHLPGALENGAGVVGRRRPRRRPDRRHAAALRRRALRAVAVVDGPRLARAPDAGPGGRGPVGRPAAQRASRRTPVLPLAAGSPDGGARPPRRRGQPRRRRLERRVGPRLPDGRRRAPRQPFDVVTVRRRRRPRPRRRGRRGRRRRGGRRRLHLPRRGRVHRRPGFAADRGLPRRRRARRGRAVRGLEGHRPPDHDDRRASARTSSVRCRRRPHVAAPARARRRADPRRRRGPTRAPSSRSRPAARSCAPSGSTPSPPSCRPGTAAAEAGPGLADVLLGTVEPVGRLPFSVPTTRPTSRAFDRDADAFRYDRWHGWWHLARTGRRAGASRSGSASPTPRSPSTA